jgi:hypothetical protein
LLATDRDICLLRSLSVWERPDPVVLAILGLVSSARRRDLARFSYSETVVTWCIQRRRAARILDVAAVAGRWPGDP